MKSKSRMPDKEGLVEEFFNLTILETEALKNRTVKVSKVNKLAAKSMKVFDALVQYHGDVGREALLRGLSHERDDVRTAVACLLLRYANKEATKVLEEIRDKDKGLFSFEAGQALLRWQEGTWALDLPDEGRTLE